MFIKKLTVMLIMLLIITIAFTAGCDVFDSKNTGDDKSPENYKDSGNHKNPGNIESSIDKSSVDNNYTEGGMAV